MDVQIRFVLSGKLLRYLRGKWNIEGGELVMRKSGELCMRMGERRAGQRQRRFGDVVIEWGRGREKRREKRVPHILPFLLSTLSL